MISDPVLLLAFMFAVVAFTRFLENHFKFVEKISSAVLCTLLGITFANIGLIPTTAASATNATVFEFAIPYTIVLVIIGTNVREIFTAGRPLVITYLFAVFGSFAGGLACGVFMNAWVGPENCKLIGAFAGAYDHRASPQAPAFAGAGAEKPLAGYDRGPTDRAGGRSDGEPARADRG